MLALRDAFVPEIFEMGAVLKDLVCCYLRTWGQKETKQNSCRRRPRVQRMEQNPIDEFTNVSEV